MFVAIRHVSALAITIDRNLIFGFSEAPLLATGSFQAQLGRRRGSKQPLSR
jgi:hypothetical protein